MPIGARTYSESLEMTVNVYRALGALLVRCDKEGVLVGDEGGFGPKLPDESVALARLASTAFDVERESSRSIASNLGFRQL